MRILCVAEKPSIAKSIANTLGGGIVEARNSNVKFIRNYDFIYTFESWGNCQVTMTSVAGHISDLEFPPQYGWGKVRPIDLFEAPLRIRLLDGKNQNGRKMSENIKKEAQNADILMIWTDCDREGEYIGYEIVQAAQKGNPNLKDGKVARANFNNLERSHIRYAANHPLRLDMRQVRAVEARLELDLRVGYSFTRFQTNEYQSRFPGLKDHMISYGTCQFPTLGFIVDRYKRKTNFIPEKFWSIAIEVSKDGKNVQFTWNRVHLFDRLVTSIIFENCMANPKAQVVSVINKPTSKWKPLPLTTVELQKNGSRYLKMSAKSVLDVAEKLYQQGYVSYPRTETNQFDKAMDLRRLVEKQTGHNDWGDYARSLIDNKFKEPRKGKNNDHAHPPIHPVNLLQKNVLPAESFKVYEFITRHFLACCSEDAIGDLDSVELDWEGEKFSASGLHVKERNFLEVYPYWKWENTKVLPEFQLGEAIELSSAMLKEGKTAGPNILTEPELIALMDANGIGTDATIAEHIEKVIQRQFVEKSKAGGQTIFVPTTLGMALIDGYEEMGLEISLSKPYLRRQMELGLKDICNGKVSKDIVLHELLHIYKGTFCLCNQKKQILMNAYQKYVD